MSIPQRFYRIAKNKLSEIKDRIDQWDEEAEREAVEAAKRSQSQVRADSRRELDDALTSPLPPSASSSSTADPRPHLPASVPPLRTPDEIARGARPANSAPPPASNTSASQDAQAVDPLAYHYRLLGVEVGADFVTVQTAYNRLAARSDPSRFPAGSDDAKSAQEIRARLDASYAVLRDALDATARRFDHIEY